MIRNRWRLFAWSLLGAALLVLVSWPLMIWWHLSNGVPLIPAAFEPLLWPQEAGADRIIIRTRTAQTHGLNVPRITRRPDHARQACAV